MFSKLKNLFNIGHIGKPHANTNISGTGQYRPIILANWYISLVLLSIIVPPDPPKSIDTAVKCNYDGRSVSFQN